ncbi:hypothetical protein CL176_10775 [Suicoccus acidiformans]|uniref:HTH tetR-type domain-containing protein n=1 Tax=Suicoccus acidiformans TaxID=2036206 RepID=A0A347WMY0_9LACT|nr:TetR/AcrR family transcriptional regulator [Suicoccus acidiformans]AXY26437.1 hypothetical protein CL176_10775 [Suicoccus acidiformans]
MNKGNMKAQQSQEAILNALLYLMEIDEYPFITISQIASHANVSRVTFYRNFESKEAVLKLKIQKIIHDYISIHGRLEHLNFNNISELLFNIIIENIVFFKLLVENKLLYLFTEPFYESILAENQIHRAYLWEQYDQRVFKNVLSLTFGGYEQFIIHHIFDENPSVEQWKADFNEALQIINQINSQTPQ